MYVDYRKAENLVIQNFVIGAIGVKNFMFSMKWGQKLLL